MIRKLVPALVLIACCALNFEAQENSPIHGIGVDVDFYTGTVSQDVWIKMKDSGVHYVYVQACGGRNRNEFALTQLQDARASAWMQSCAYVLLNYDDKVCPTFAKPVRDKSGACLGKLVQQSQPGARWQVRQGMAA